MKRKLLALLLACLMISSTLFVFSSCSSSNDEITVWIGGSIVGEDELEESQDSWIISQLLQEYEELNDVKIKLTYFEDEEAMVQLIANNGRSDNEVPDIACVYSSEIIRDMADVVYPITDYISDEEKQSIMFWETVTNNGKGLDQAEEVYGYPIGGTEVTFIAYNKAIFASAGIDVESNPPKTFDEFYAICERLKAEGVTPIVASDDGWNELYLQVFSKEWVQYSGDANIIEMSQGTKKFADDQALINSLKTANTYFENGFINSDYATNTDAPTLFANGQGAMFSCSNYDLNMFESIMGDNLGAFILPDFSDGDVVYSNISFGGCNQCLSTFNGSKNKEEAIKIIKWLANKENNIRMVQKFGCFPNRNDIALSEYDDNPSEIIAKVYPLLPYAHSTPDYLMPMKVYSDFYRYSLSVMIGQMTPEEFVAKLDDVTNEK